MTYCFICDNCGRQISGDILSLDAVKEVGSYIYKCSNCGSKLRRDYKAEQVNFILIGDGFYSTTNRNRQEV